MKKIIIFITLILLLSGSSFAAQTAVVSGDTREQAWAKETLNNADLQNNITAKVTAPATSVDNSIFRYNGTDSNIAQDSLVIINDDGDIVPIVDDSQTLGDITHTFENAFFTTENGNPFSIRQLALSNRDLRDDTAAAVYSAANSVSGGVWTYTITEDNSEDVLVFIINKIAYVAAGPLSVDIEALAGTDANPNDIWVYAHWSGSALELVAANTHPVTEHVDVGYIKAGAVSASSATIYAEYETNLGAYEFIHKVYHRFSDEGAVYKTGMDSTATATDLTIGVGSARVILEDISTISRTVSTDNLFYINNDGTYTTINDFAFDEYSDGGAIGTNKYYNVVIGILPDTPDRLLAVVQNTPASEYTNVSGAFTDISNTMLYFPSDSTLKSLFIPVCRVMVINDANDELQQFPGTTDYCRDVRDSRGGGGSAASTTNTVDGNIESDTLFWNASSGQYEPKTIAEAQTLLEIVTEFLTNVFRIQDNTDPTKEIAFDASGITTGNTRTITMPDADVDLTDSGTPEGTAVKSTGETGGVKFLGEDGDGTSSWKVPGGGGDVVGPAGGVVDNEIPLYDSTTGKLIKGSGATIDSNGLTLVVVPIPINNYPSSDSDDADQTSATTRCVVTLGTAGSVESDYYIAVKDGGDASGVETDAIHVDGSASLVNMLFPATGTFMLDASGFDGNLGTGDDTLQEVAQAFDDFSAGGVSAYEAGTEADFYGTILNPQGVYDNDSTNHALSFAVNIPAAFTITAIYISCDADPTTEPTLTFQHKAAGVGYGTPTTIEAVTTTAGVASITSGIDDPTIPADTKLFITLSDPDDALNEITWQIKGDWD